MENRDCEWHIIVKRIERHPYILPGLCRFCFVEVTKEGLLKKRLRLRLFPSRDLAVSSFELRIVFSDLLGEFSEEGLNAFSLLLAEDESNRLYWHDQIWGSNKWSMSGIQDSMMESRLFEKRKSEKGGEYFNQWSGYILVKMGQGQELLVAGPTTTRGHNKNR